MYYSGIEPCDVLNGTGFRTVIWVSGCSLECKGCFNPNTHNPNYGTKYTQETQRYLLDCLSKDYIDGITITGGNPLENYNLDSVLSLINEIRILLPNKTIWLYTGFTWEEIFYPIVTSDLNLDRDKIIRDRQEIVKNVDILIDDGIKICMDDELAFEKIADLVKNEKYSLDVAEYTIKNEQRKVYSDSARLFFTDKKNVEALFR